MGMNVVVSCPEGFDPDESVMVRAEKIVEGSGGKLEVIRDPQKAVEGADVLYTDVWVSMGQETVAKSKVKKFKEFQLNDNLVSRAKDDCSVMHCLPAHRGQEITDEVLEGKQSVVWDQAENRLHAQKAIFAYLY